VGDEEQAVDFGNGPRLAERAGKLDKEVDDPDFHRVQGPHSGQVRRLRFVRVTDAHVASLAEFPICSIKNEQNLPAGLEAGDTTGLETRATCHASGRLAAAPGAPADFMADLICRFINIGQFMDFNPAWNNRA
jgi:hypothetical protein